MHLRLAFPALTLIWVLGMGMVGMSDDAWEISDTWIVLSLLGWVVAMVASWFLIRPALTDTSERARSRMGAGIGITHVVLVVVLYLMIFKPGALSTSSRVRGEGQSGTTYSTGTQSSSIGSSSAGVKTSAGPSASLPPPARPA